MKVVRTNRIFFLIFSFDQCGEHFMPRPLPIIHDFEWKISQKDIDLLKFWISYLCFDILVKQNLRGCRWVFTDIRTVIKWWSKILYGYFKTQLHSTFLFSALTLQDFLNHILPNHSFISRCIPTQHIEKKCGSELRGRGFIMSGSYPRYYMGGQVCSWSLKLRSKVYIISRSIYPAESRILHMEHKFPPSLILDF